MAGKTKFVTTTGIEVVEDESATAGTEPLNIDAGGTGALTARAAAASLLIPYLLGKSSVPLSSSNDTNETAFASVTVPALAQGNNGQIRVSMAWACTNSGTAKTVRVRYSTITGVAFFSQNLSTTAGVNAVAHIGQNNSTFSQVGSAFGVNSAGTGVYNYQAATAAADTSAATTLVISGQKGTGTDTLTLSSYIVELLYGA